MSGPRVGIYGLLGSGNIGNDGSFDAMLAFIGDRHPDAIVDVFTDSPERVTATWGLPGTRMHWNRGEYSTAATIGAILRKGIGKIIDAARIAAWVRRHDVVIMAGMGAFEATLPLRAWGTPYTQFLVCALGRRLGARLGWVSVGSGGEVDRATRWLFVAAARNVHYLSHRDAYSRGVMRRWGLAERGDEIYPDLVYSLPTPAVPTARTGVVGVGVIDYHGANSDRARADELNAAYGVRITQLVDRILDDGREVRLFTGDRVDERIVDRVVEHVRAHRPQDASRLHADPVRSLRDLMEQMAGVDLVVATRFHNVLCALKMARPTISLGYGDKNAALMVDMGLGDYCHHVATFDPEVVYGQLDELAAQHDELTAAMAIRVGELRARLDKQFDAIDGVLFDARTSAGALTEGGTR